MKRFFATWRHVAGAFALFGALLLGVSVGERAAGADAPESIRIGYSIQLSGWASQGARASTLPNYQLWVKDVNDAGGIYLSKYDKKVPIEVVEYDNGSKMENAVRDIERLIIKDEVDFVLPPWGTAFNMAVAPLFEQYGYPLFPATAAVPEGLNTQDYPNVLWFTFSAEGLCAPLVDVLATAHAEGKINNKVALVNVADTFGVEMAKAVAPMFREAGFEIVYEKNYPLNVQDLTPLLNEIRQTDADSFVSMSYPADTMMWTEQARIAQYNPKVFYAAVGTAFPFFKGKFGEGVEGVMGYGGWNPDIPGAREYIQRHAALAGHEPDRGASLATFASVQVLQQAIEQVGEIDRQATRDAIAAGTFETVIGPVSFSDDLTIESLFVVGQWQNGQFRGVGPSDKAGAAALVVPKQSW